MKPNAPEIPLCTNIIRLQSYLIAPDEVILFDWLVVKQVSFKFQDFHYSQARIEEETRIKRTRQEQIISHFTSLGFLSAEVGVNKETRGRVRYFKVDFEVLTNNNVLNQIINEKEPLFGNFIKYMKYLSIEQGKAAKPQKKESYDAATANRIYKLLNETYDARRKMYNSGRLTNNKKPKRTKSETQLPRNKNIEKKLESLANIYSDSTIDNAFIAYIDSVFIGEVAPSKIMEYFLSYDDTNKSFGVLEYNLNKFNLEYSKS